MERSREGSPRTSARAGAAEDPLELVRRRLLRQASLFEDPAAYAAGVEDTVAAVGQLFRDDVGSAPAVPAPSSSSAVAPRLEGAAG